MTTPLSYAF